MSNSWARNIKNQQNQYQSFKPQPLAQPNNTTTTPTSINPTTTTTPTPLSNVTANITPTTSPQIPRAATSSSPSTGGLTSLLNKVTSSPNVSNIVNTTTTTSTIPTTSNTVSTTPPKSNTPLSGTPLKLSSGVTPTASTTVSSATTTTTTTGTSVIPNINVTSVNQTKISPPNVSPTTNSLYNQSKSSNLQTNVLNTNKVSMTSKPSYYQPTAIQPKILTEDVFRGDGFSPVNFVEDLTRQLVNDQNTSKGLKFKASPFNTLFINTRMELSKLESMVDQRMDNLVRDCSESEKDYKFKLSNLIDSYQVCFQQFKQLEKGVNTIGTKAVHFGDELDSVNQQKNKAQSALSLINHLLELNDTAVVKRSEVFTNPERTHELAAMVKKLTSIGEDLKDMNKFGHFRDETEIISNSLENNLLNQFERAAERKDYEKMKECAATLYDFNGGKSCRERYISKLKMFFDADSMNRDEALAKATSKRIIRGQQIVEDGRFDLFFSEILKDVAQEQDIIQRVFNNQTLAMEMLIVRIFEQRVTMFLENILFLEANNQQSYLQTLYFSIMATKKNLVEPLSSYGIMGIDFNVLMSSLYFPYQEKYISQERLSLIDSFNRVLEEEVERLDEMSKSGEFDIGGLNPETTQTIIHGIENALTRSFQLSLPGGQYMPENIKTIFFILIEYLFSQYITYTLDRASKLLPVTDSKCFQSLEQLFYLILSINQIVGQVQTLYQLFVLPNTQTFIQIQSQCSDQLLYAISNIEAKICISLEKSLLIISQLIDKQLLKQDKQDYLNNKDYDNMVTDTCRQVVQLVQQIYDLTKASLQGKNFLIFIEEIGLKLQSQFLAHYKKFKVGQGDGALKILRDLTEYRNTMKQFKSHKVDDAFEVLFELSKLHLLSPDSFKSIIEGGSLSKMPKSDLIVYIKQRTDFQSSWLDNL